MPARKTSGRIICVPLLVTPLLFPLCVSPIPITTIFSSHRRKMPPEPTATKSPTTQRHYLRPSRKLLLHWGCHGERTSQPTRAPGERSTEANGISTHVEGARAAVRLGWLQVNPATVLRVRPTWRPTGAGASFRSACTSWCRPSAAAGSYVGLPTAKLS